MKAHLLELFSRKDLQFLKENLEKLFEQFDIERKTHNLYIKVLDLLEIQLPELEILQLGVFTFENLDKIKTKQELFE